jgi:membrane protein required for colicin V production
VAANDLAQSLQHLGWVDISAISVLAVFFVLGLFKGIVWQVSRVAILVAAYFASVKLGFGFGEVLLSWTHTGQEPPSEDQQATALYIACVLIFVGVLLALSLCAMVLQNLIRRVGLGFYDRLFGGLLGVATGALVVLSMHIVLRMFFAPESRVAAAAKESHSLRLAKDAVALLGDRLPLMRELLEGRAGPTSAGAAGAAMLHRLEPVEATGESAGEAINATEPKSGLRPDRDH